MDAVVVKVYSDMITFLEPHVLVIEGNYGVPCSEDTA